MHFLQNDSTTEFSKAYMGISLRDYIKRTSKKSHVNQIFTIRTRKTEQASVKLARVVREAGSIQIPFNQAAVSCASSPCSYHGYLWSLRVSRGSWVVARRSIRKIAEATTPIKDIQPRR